MKNKRLYSLFNAQSNESKFIRFRSSPVIFGGTMSSATKYKELFINNNCWLIEKPYK